MYLCMLTTCWIHSIFSIFTKYLFVLMLRTYWFLQWEPLDLCIFIYPLSPCNTMLTSTRKPARIHNMWSMLISFCLQATNTSLTERVYQTSYFTAHKNNTWPITEGMSERHQVNSQTKQVNLLIWLFFAFFAQFQTNSWEQYHFFVLGPSTTLYTVQQFIYKSRCSTAKTSTFWLILA